MRSLVRKLWRFAFPAVTYEWCARRAVMSCHWLAEKSMCHNGKPVGSGWFIMIVQFGPTDADKVNCDEFVAEMNAPAPKRN